MSRDEANTAMVHAALMLLGIVAATWRHAVPLLSTVAVLSLVRWVWRQRAPWRPGARWGVANTITSLRVALTASIAWLPDEALTPWGGVIVLLVFALDGLDGWWARRTGTASSFGAAFDQEADAMLVAVVSTALVSAALASPWIILTGALRYAYVLTVWGLRLRGEAPRSTIARYAFGILVTCFIAALVYPGPLTRGALSLAAALIVASFMRSLFWSWRGPAPGGGDKA